MALNIALLTTAAPYIIDAANRIISLINKNKKEKQLQDQVLDHDESLAFILSRQNELLVINEQQSQVIKDLAEQNQRMVLALRNTRIISLVALLTGVVSFVLLFVLK